MASALSLNSTAVNHLQIISHARSGLHELLLADSRLQQFNMLKKTGPKGIVNLSPLQYTVPFIGNLDIIGNDSSQKKRMFPVNPL